MRAKSLQPRGALWVLIKKSFKTYKVDSLQILLDANCDVDGAIDYESDMDVDMDVPTDAQEQLHPKKKKSREIGAKYKKTQKKSEKFLPSTTDTPLACAIQEGAWHMVDFLIERGAKQTLLEENLVKELNAYYVRKNSKPSCFW